MLTPEMAPAKVTFLTVLSNVIDFVQEQTRSTRSKSIWRAALGGLAAFVVV